MTEETNGHILVELLHGNGAHVDSLACVEDVSAKLAGCKCAAFPHSIWQVLRHMDYWMNYGLERIRDERPVYPAHASESWPGDSALPDEEGWKQTVGRFSTLIDELAVLAGSTHDILLRRGCSMRSLSEELSNICRMVRAPAWLAGVNRRRIRSTSTVLHSDIAIVSQ